MNAKIMNAKRKKSEKCHPWLVLQNTDIKLMLDHLKVGLEKDICQWTFLNLHWFTKVLNQEGISHKIKIFVFLGGEFVFNVIERFIY